MRALRVGDTVRVRIPEPFVPKPMLVTGRYPPEATGLITIQDADELSAIEREEITPAMLERAKAYRESIRARGQKG